MDTGFRRDAPSSPRRLPCHPGASPRHPGESRGLGEKCPLDSGFRRNDERGPDYLLYRSPSFRIANFRGFADAFDLLHGG